MSAAEPIGMNVFEVRQLPWDTDFFGARMGEVVVHANVGGTPILDRAVRSARDLRTLLRNATLDGYEHLSLRAAADDLPTIWAAQEVGFRLLDVSVELSCAVHSSGMPESSARVGVRTGTPTDIPLLQEMTEGAFGLTRYAVDPFFTSGQVSRFYRTWVANLFNGLADCVLVGTIDDRPAGFFACARRGGRGRIPLVATHRDRRRLGVGSRLIAESLRWFAGEGVDFVDVKTQAGNRGAMALYQQSGFTIAKTELAFSVVLDAKPF